MTPGLESRYGQGLLTSDTTHPKIVTLGENCPALNNLLFSKEPWGSLKELLQKAKLSPVTLPGRTVRKGQKSPCVVYAH